MKEILDEDTDRKQRQRRNREPLFYCKVVTKWPRRTFLLVFLGHALMIAISGILYATGYDILPIVFDNVPMDVAERPYDGRRLAWASRDDFPGYYERSTASKYRNKISFESSINLFYEAKNDGNIFTRQTLMKIQEIENQIVNANEFEKYCFLNFDGNQCEKPVSILRYFDGTYSMFSPIFNDPTFDNIPAVLYEASINNATKSNFYFFLGASNTVTPSSVVSTITRSKVLIGYPLEGFSGDSFDLENRFRDYLSENFDELLFKLHDEVDVLTFSFRSQYLWRVNLFKQAMKDVRWAIASVGFIFLVILIHTRSIFMTVFSIFGIITSFVAGNLFYNVILGFRFIGLFHILTLFIILGIGADNVFVFFDVWRNSASEVYPSLAHRLSDIYRQTIFSMLFTSLTTAVAFLSTAIAPLLATKSFGVFAAVVVMINFLSVSIFFPAVVIVYHIYLRKIKLPCVILFHKMFRKQDKEKHNTEESQNVWLRRSYLETFSNDNFTSSENTDKANNNGIVKSEPNSYSGFIYPGRAKVIKLSEMKRIWNTEQSLHHDEVNYRSLHLSNHSYSNSEIKETAPSHSKNKSLVPNSTSLEHSSRDSHLSRNSVNKTHMNGVTEYHHKRNKSNSNYSSESKASKKSSITSRFLMTKYFNFITNKYARWVILLLFAGLIGFAIYESSTIVPDNELFDILPEDNVFTISENHIKNSFDSRSDEQTLSVFVVWGLLPNTLGDCQRVFPCEGQRSYDASFNPHTSEAQIALKEFCQTIEQMSAAKANDLRLKIGDDGKYKVNCLISNMEQYLKQSPNTSGTDWEVPFDLNKVQRLMLNRPDVYNISALTTSFDVFLQVPLSYWLSNGYTFQPLIDSAAFKPLVAEEVGPHSQPVLTRPDKQYGNNIKYIAVEIKTTIMFRSIGYTEGLPILDNWESFIEAQMSKMPEGMKGGFQTDNRELWRWLNIQQTLTQNAVYGAVIGLCLALVIFILATGNIITGAIATLSVGASTVCVVAVIPIGGWKLGMTEALVICMIVGLTVDYVLHLAEGYTLSLHNDRLSRVRDMLGMMGEPILFGAFTSLGAALFLFFAVLRFFFQFGVFLFSTLGFSLIHSLVLFATLMAMIGPQRDVGNIWALFKRVLKHIRNRKYRR